MSILKSPLFDNPDRAPAQSARGRVRISFFFQAEDGIRDGTVTGVQTCALPILVVMTTVSFYTITVYTPTFGKSVLKLSDTDSLLVTFCVGLSNFVWLPVMGALSDRVGRKPILLAFSALTLLTAYPALAWLVGHASFGNMLLVLLWLAFAGACGLAATLLVHRERATGLAGGATETSGPRARPAR